MIVKHILAGKGGNVATIEPTAEKKKGYANTSRVRKSETFQSSLLWNCRKRADVEISNRLSLTRPPDTLHDNPSV
jgi:hypothetical protein